MELRSDGDGVGQGREKRRRVDEQGFRFEETPAATKGADSIPAARFSDLPTDLRHRILMLLPIKDAIRTAALDQSWRDLWKGRWHPASSRDIHLLPRDIPNTVLDALEEGGPRRRLDRFSLVVENGKFRPKHLKRFLVYAAACRVEDLHVELRRGKLGSNLAFHFALSSPRLVHLSLRGIGISNMYYRGVRPFPALEAIHLHSVRICELTFKRMMALCPRLRTLDLRRCDFKGLPHGAEVLVPTAGKTLRSVTVEECEGEVKLRVVAMPSLCSFRYSGNYEASPFFLPRDAALSHLYISCADPKSRHFSLFPNSFDEGLPDDLSRLTVLTICSNALKVASTWLNTGATAQWTSLCNLQSLRELQLIMFSMDIINLANIYVFLRASNCRNLERVFVQLPAISDVPLENLFVEVGVEPLEDGLDNLRMVKIMNFNWRCFELQLVSFLLKNARSLHKLQVVSPNVALLNVPGVPEADLLVIKDALGNGRMMLSESDDAAIRPFHSEVFIDV